MRTWPALALIGCTALLTPACTQDPDDDDDSAAAEVTLDTPELEVRYDPLKLSELALAAVERAPAWLRDDLAISLARVDDDVMEQLAALIVDEGDPYLVDEIAFGVAHTSPEVLGYWGFHPELLRVNAEYVYLADPQLDYVQLEEVGEPDVDDDYHTTATYRVQEDDGSVVDKTIDREIYYWYVVHPRLEDEAPFFIDGWDDAEPTGPDDGWFWREFLWNRALEECPTEERECPVLDGWMEGIDVLWTNTTSGYEDGGALGRVFAFVHTAIVWGAGDERPVQPVRIYVVGCGNCGEHADMASATARTALIPAQNIGAFSNDHVWDEFWDERWVHFDTSGSGMDWYGNYHGGVSRDLRDNDCDGIADFGDDTEDADGDGVAAADGDCDDTDPAIHPGAAELANGHDDDCDGVADDAFADSEIDADGDGHSIAAGDCDDGDAERHPGAPEDTDGVDDDCDGIADTGDDLEDHDGDGWTMADGDCDDTDAAVSPAAIESADGRDEDCDGEADEGFTEHDRDGDGFTIADGDCHDLHGGFHPDARDPGLGGNRLYVITGSRGDTHLSTERTEDYATRTSTLEFDVVDPDGVPVDGAVVSLYGTWEVYGYPDEWAWAGETVTDLDGHAVATVGETNPYGYAVTSAVGDEPGAGYLIPGVDFTMPGESYGFEVTVGAMPAALEATEVGLPDDAAAEARWTIELEVESHRVEADGMWFGSMSLDGEGGRVDLFVVDDDSYDLMKEEEPFDAILVERDAASSAPVLDLPLDRDWMLVLSNEDSAATTMVGVIRASVEPGDGYRWSGDVAPVEQRFRIPPGKYYSIKLDP